MAKKRMTSESHQNGLPQTEAELSRVSQQLWEVRQAVFRVIINELDVRLAEMQKEAPPLEVQRAKCNERLRELKYMSQVAGVLLVDVTQYLQEQAPVVQQLIETLHGLTKEEQVKLDDVQSKILRCVEAASDVICTAKNELEKVGYKRWDNFEGDNTCVIPWNLKEDQYRKYRLYENGYSQDIGDKVAAWRELLQSCVREGGIACL